MPNSIVQAFRRRYPDDQRTDDELTLAIGGAYPEYADAAKFPDFHSDLQRLTQAVAPQPNETPPEITPYPPTIGEYGSQALGSAIRGFTRTLGAIPEAVGSVARIAGTYSVPGAEYVPMRFETEPGGIETALTRAGEAISPEPVPGLEKSFLATEVPGGVASGAAFIVGGAGAGAAEMGLVRTIGLRALARAEAGGIAREAALKIGQDAATSAAKRLSYGNIASLGALSQAQQGYEEARRAGADEHTRWLAFSLNLPVGMTEAVPLANILNRFDKISGGTLKQTLIHAGVDTFEEAIQNSLQGVAGDVIAARIAKYEPDRKLFSSLAEDAASGGISAAILSLAMSAIGGKARPQTTQQPPAPGSVPPLVVPGTPPPAGPAAPDVAAQYANPEERAREHSSRMLEAARRQVFGGFGTDDISLVRELPPNEMVIYQGLVEQARKEQDAANQRIEQQRVEEERVRNAARIQKEGEDRQRQAEEQSAGAAGGAGGGVSPAAGVGLTPSATTDAAPASGGQPATAPEKEVVAPPPAMAAPVVFHSVMAVPGLPPVIYYTPTTELRGKDGGLYKPGDTITEQNLAGFTIPFAEFSKANIEAEKARQGTPYLQPPAKPVATQPAAPAVGTVYLPPALEAVAQKVASPTGERLTAAEQAMLPKTTDAIYAQYQQRVSEIKAGLPPAAAPPVIAPAPAVVPPAPPVTPPVATPPKRAPLPSPVATVSQAPPGKLQKKEPVLTRARKAAVALATTVKQKVAAVVHASPILDTIDFDADSPLSFELSGRGAGTKTRADTLDPNLVFVGSGDYQGYKGTLVTNPKTGQVEKGDASTGKKAKVKLDNGHVIEVATGDYKTLRDIRKDLQEGTGAMVALAPVYFELREPPAANDKALQDAGLVSQASMNTDLPEGEKGSRNTWTHRWTAFRVDNRILLLPTYKSEGKIMAAEAGKKKGTPVVTLMTKRGYTPIASFRAEKAQHAIRVAKPVMGVDEWERTFASHARERMAASARTAAAMMERMQATQAITTETVTGSVVSTKGDRTQAELPGAEEVVAGGAAEPTTGPEVADESVRLKLSFSDELAHDIFPKLTKVLTGTTGRFTNDNIIGAIADYSKKGKHGQELTTEIVALAGDIGAPRASRAILKHFVRAYNNSRTSKEFADILSGRVAPAQPAATGERGLPGAASSRPEGRRVQPAVQAPGGNAAVAGPAPAPAPTPTLTQSWQRSQPKFRIVENGGGYMAVDEVIAKLQAVLENLAASGVDVTLLQQRIDAIGEEFFGRSGGVQQGNAVALVLADITKPTIEDFISALHEGVHVVAARESQEMQRRMHRAMEQLSDAALGLEGTGDLRARLQNAAGLDPETLAEERLAESLANEGFDPIAARSWSQRIMRFLKDIWNRACIAIQESLFGEGAVNPERVVEYYRNRLQSLLAGDSVPSSFVNFLGGKKMALERSARFYVPTAEVDTFEPVVVDWDSGEIIYAKDASATEDAVIANIRNAVRSGEASFRKPGSVAEGEPVGGENPTVRGTLNFAAANNLLGSLQAMYDAFNASGANPPNAAGVRPVTFDLFVGLSQGDLAHPEAMKATVQGELDAIGAPQVNPDMNVFGPVTPQSDAFRKQSGAISLRQHNQYLANLNEVFTTAVRNKDVIGRQLERKINRAEQLVNKWQSLSFYLENFKEAIGDLITQTKEDIREGIGLAKHVGMLTQAIKELDSQMSDPTRTDYRQLIDRMANRIFNNAEHFTEFLEDVAAMDVDWHGQTLPQIKAQLRVLLDANPLFSGMNSDEKNIALALVGSFARSNDHQMAWLALKSSNAYEARDAIADMLNEAKKDTTANLNNARALVNKVPGAARQAQRILDQYVRARQEARSWLDEQARNTRILQAHAAAAPILGQRIRDLEKFLGGNRPVALIEGAKLPMVMSPTDTPEEIAARAPWEYHSTGDMKVTPAQVGSQVKNYEAWIEANRDTGGAMVETLKDLVLRLNMDGTARKAGVGLRQGFLARAMASLSDACFQSGSVIAQRIGKALTRYSFLEGSYTRELANLGIAVAADRARAIKALGIKDVNYFKTTFHDGAFGYFEKRKDLLEGPNPVETALSAWRSVLLANPTTRPLVTPAAWEKLKNYYLQCRTYNKAQARIAGEMGIQIQDENLGMFRDPIGDPLFTTPRGLNSRIEQLFHKMRGQWNGVRSPRITAADMAEKFAADPAALQTALKARFTPEVWQLFVKEMANRDGRSLFSGREWAPKKWTIAQVEHVRRAFNEAGGDPLVFASRLHALEGGTPDTLPAFVGETLETFQNYFNAIENIMKESEDAHTLFGLQKGVPRFLMDARVSEDFPTGWLQYQNMDEYHARQAVHRFAFHSAFGRNGSTVSADFDKSIGELKTAADEWEEYLRRTRELNPTKNSREIVKAARELATSEGKNVSLLENARQNEAVIRKTQDQMAAWFKSHSEDSVEPKVFLEMLSFMTGLMVQGPKTAMINTMDLIAGPIIQYGLTKDSLRQVRDNWTNFAGSVFGSLFQTFGVQINANVEDRLLLQRIGHTDPDNQVKLIDRFVAAVHSDVPSARRLSPAIIRAGRVLRIVTQAGLPSRTEGEGLYPTLKAAPFSMISRSMNEAFILANWGRFRGFVGKAMEYLEAHPAAIDDVDFQFTADMLGYTKGHLIDDAQSFEALKEAMNRWGMSLETVARAALKPDAPIFTDDQHRALAEMALEEMSLEASPNTAPRWGGNPVGRFAMPLLRWSFAKTNQLRKSFQEPNGEKNLHAVMSGLKALALASGVGIGYALLMGKYDEELTGKKSNIRGFGQDNNFLAAIEMTARMGSLGLWGDVANTLGNYAGTGDLRGLSLDNRVVFVNSLINTMSALTTWAKQGDATYATVYRQLLQALGGSGYLQIAQILNNELSLDNAEARVTSRINVNNWLRAVGREMNLDVRVGRAAGATVNANSIKPWVGEMVLAAYADDQADFILSYSKAIEAARAEGKPDPVKHVQMSYAAYNPLRTVYQTPPTDAEYMQILARLPDSGRADVQMAILLFNKFGNQIGVKEYEGKVEKVKPPQLVSPATVRRNVAQNLFPVYR